ncbi:hypothetical protein BDV93DRAFT_523280 [Ceratobasidium sp. AG-I]|nr:hypothetical protein BDV93DRAFT_523280 [Ceratobasidium sp. AG-I]
MLQNEPNFVWCKSAACNWGQVHEGGAGTPIVICQACQSRACFTHDVPWHAGLTCDQYDAERARQVEEVQANEGYLRENTKACPNEACRRKIEKNEGCDHMTCRLPVGCGHEFCWLCLADYAPIRAQGNHHHKTNCRHYAAIEAPRPVHHLPPLRYPHAPTAHYPRAPLQHHLPHHHSYPNYYAPHSQFAPQAATEAEWENTWGEVSDGSWGVGSVDTTWG